MELNEGPVSGRVRKLEGRAERPVPPVAQALLPVWGLRSSLADSAHQLRKAHSQEWLCYLFRKNPRRIA